MNHFLLDVRTCIAYAICGAVVLGLGLMWGHEPAIVDEELLAACDRGDVAAIERALARGANPNTRWHPETTALISAARGGHLGAARCLLDHGADLNATAPACGTALTTAAVFDCTELARELIARGASVNDANEFGNRPLYFAATCGSPTMLRLLIDAGAPVNSENYGGVTPLMAAASAGNVQAVRILLSAGADVSAVDQRQDRASSRRIGCRDHGTAALRTGAAHWCCAPLLADVPQLPQRAPRDCGDVRHRVTFGPCFVR